MQNMHKVLLPGERMVLPLYTALVRQHLAHCSWLWAPQCKRGMDVLERALCRATKILKAQEHLCCEILWEHGSSAWRRLTEILSTPIKCLRGRNREEALLSGAWCWDWRHWARTGTQENPSEYQETLFHCNVDYIANVPGNIQKLYECGSGWPCLNRGTEA